jgi:hypothetical protein
MACVYSYTNVGSQGTHWRDALCRVRPEKRAPSRPPVLAWYFLFSGARGRVRGHDGAWPSRHPETGERDFVTQVQRGLPAGGYRKHTAVLRTSRNGFPPWWNQGMVYTGEGLGQPVCRRNSERRRVFALRRKQVATKYTRRRYRECASGTQRWANRPPRIFSLGLRQRLALVYLGIAGFTVVLVFAQVILPRIQFQGQPTIEIEGFVVNNTAANASTDRAYRLAVEVRPPGRATIRGVCTTEFARWQALRPGDQVLVRCQPSRWGRVVRIQELLELPLDVPAP